jgi:hypothetical protein
MLTLIRTLFVIAILFFTANTRAACNYYWDKIRDRQLEQIDCHSEDGNSVIIVDYRERIAVLQYKSAIRQVGVHFSKPQALKWPQFTSNRFTIRFDPDSRSIIQLHLSGVDREQHLYLWPLCASRPDGDCGAGLPRIDHNMQGFIKRYTAVDQRPAQSLIIAQPQDFENFNILVRGSSRIVLEVSATDSPVQLEFITR